MKTLDELAAELRELAKRWTNQQAGSETAIMFCAGMASAYQDAAKLVEDMRDERDT